MKDTLRNKIITRLIDQLKKDYEPMCSSFSLPEKFCISPFDNDCREGEAGEAKAEIIKYYDEIGNNIKLNFASERTKINPFAYPKSFLKRLYLEYARMIINECEYQGLKGDANWSTVWTKRRKNKLIKELQTFIEEC